MVKSELIQRSPLRILENSIHGGVGKGNIGMLASRKGVGKTACLVHIATDKLLRDRHLIHVSFSERTDHIINWYEDIFKEIAKKRDLEGAVEVHDEIIKNRVIMNFNQEGVDIERVFSSVQAMIKEGNFQADAIIIDGFDFSKAQPSDLEKFKNFAVEMNLEIWFSASLKGDEPLFNKNGLPIQLLDYLDFCSVLISLAYRGEHVHLQLIKDNDTVSTQDLHLKLDPKTLLIAEE